MCIFIAVEFGLEHSLGQARGVVYQTISGTTSEVNFTFTRIAQLRSITELFAAPTIVRLMEAGVHSHPGRPVQKLAEEGQKPEQGPVLTHLLNMVEVIVLGLRQRAKVATPTIVLFMEDGVHSQLGQAVQLIAEEEHKPEQEPALIHLLNTAETIVPGLCLRPKVATPTIVLFMEAGLYSHPGQAVQLIAEEDLKPNQELAQIRPLNMAGVTALDFLLRARIATPMTAQVMIFVAYRLKFVLDFHLRNA